MVHVLFLFPKSTDPKQLDELISSFNLASKQAIGARSYERSVGDLMSPGGPPPYSRVVEMSFESLSDVMQVLQNPEKQAADQKMKDLGALILMYEVSEL